MPSIQFISDALTGIRRELVLGVSIAISTILYIFTPVLTNTTRISLGGESFRLEVPPNFKTCTFVFGFDTRISGYSISFPYSPKSDTKAPTKSTTEARGLNLFSKVLHIENLLETRINSLDFLNGKSPEHLEVVINHRELTPVELEIVKINEKSLDLNHVFKNKIFAKSKRFIKYKYIRDDLSLFLLKYNDSISNVVLTALTVCLLPLFAKLVTQKQASMSTKRFEVSIKKKYDLSDKQSIEYAKIAYGDEYTKNERFFQFLQVFGPAIGFALTISSLIAGLHPRLQANQDITKFFETIQIAMVSTLIGLLIRIIAIFLQRQNNKLFIKADNIFFNLEEQLSTKQNEESS